MRTSQCQLSAQPALCVGTVLAPHLAQCVVGLAALHLAHIHAHRADLRGTKPISISQQTHVSGSGDSRPVAAEVAAAACLATPVTASQEASPPTACQLPHCAAGDALLNNTKQRLPWRAFRSRCQRPSTCWWRGSWYRSPPALIGGTLDVGCTVRCGCECGGRRWPFIQAQPQTQPQHTPCRTLQSASRVQPTCGQSKTREGVSVLPRGRSL